MFAAVDDSSIILTPGKAVDLGLSVKWASYNVGATAPEEYGELYSWGELKKKDDYGDENTYQYYNNQTGGYMNIGSSISDTQYDVAGVQWGGKWRIPILSEMDELRKECIWQWVTYKGINGVLVTGINGNCIFLSAAGDCNGKEVDFRGSIGAYWSGTLNDRYSYNSYCLCFDSSSWYLSNAGRRRSGLSIRPVTD